MAELRGVIAPATTPFDDADQIDLGALSAQVDWLIDTGVHGIAAGGSTGEGHTLTPDEFHRVIDTSVAAARGRIVAGIITDSTKDAIYRGKLVRDLDVAALQVTPVHYLFRPDDDHMLIHFKALAEDADTHL